MISSGKHKLKQHSNYDIVKYLVRRLRKIKNYPFTHLNITKFIKELEDK